MKASKKDLNNSKSHGCLFCGPKGRNYLKEEHIIPESLGNKSFVLSPGIVCDACNQKFSKIEQYFIQNHLSSTTRLFNIDKTKRGRPPSQQIKKGKAKKHGNGSITFKQHVAPEHGVRIAFYGEDVILEKKILLNNANAKKLSIFLAKCGLETLYLKKGKIAFEKDFDDLRNYALCDEEKQKFIPFYWCDQNKYDIGLKIMQIENKIDNILFYLAIILVPGSLYVILLNHFEKNTEIDEVVMKSCFQLDESGKQYCLKKIPTSGDIERSPITIRAYCSNRKCNLEDLMKRYSCN